MRWPRYRRWIWWFFWLLLTPIRPFVCRLRVEGVEHLPRQGGAVVACNHTMGPDFVLLAYASPRELLFMAKAEAFQWHWLLSAILRAGGVFPVQRGKSDQAAIDTAVELVAAGNLIAMFPEGTRSRTGRLQRGKTGAARIALAAGTPIIPAAVTNARAVLKRRTLWPPVVTVRFGPPVHWAQNGDEATTVRLYTDTVMGEIARMLPPEQRGVYGDSADEAR
jgi:1-acyl-sn-glycerol-3-phosphate acyltransferase